ncbi:hypothetical protein SHKM778_07970 [Streptomyces sp. KM77-8]|uniref:NADH-quinone oxidoreductase subunit N n=1 Tax=Streptomyces haneummycinicus TaxID=3074435 RepID=A0AAT9HAF4_9ACTN
MSSLVQSVDWLAIAPPTITAVVGLVVLVADLFVPEARKPLLGWLSVAGLAAATLMLLPSSAPTAAPSAWSATRLCAATPRTASPSSSSSSSSAAPS